MRVVEEEELDQCVRYKRIIGDRILLIWASMFFPKATLKKVISQKTTREIASVG